MLTMQAVEVTRSLETTRLTGIKVRDVFTPLRVILLFDHSNRTLYILKGKKSALVLYFIGLRLAQVYRTHFHGNYIIKDVNDDAELFRLLDAGLEKVWDLPEIYNPLLYFDDKGHPINPQRSGPAIPLTDQDPAWRERLTFDQIQIFKDVKVTVVLDHLKKLPEVGHYHRDMILIGNTVYIPTEELTEFFQQRKMTQKFVKLGQLPEGQFFMPGYSTRLYIVNKHIQALEFFRPTDQKSDIGRIRSPILSFLPLEKMNSDSELNQAFHFPLEPNLDDLIQKVKSAQKGG
jgi:hypothetical protein